jgi:regulator of replication initiation timing
MASAYSSVAPSAQSGQDDGSITLFPKLKAWVLDSMQRHADWYKEAEECFGFVAGRSIKGKGQWPDDTWQQMLESGRQPIEFNRIGPIVDSICGLEVNNRQSIKFLPRTEGDSEVDERLSSLGDWARDETDAEDEESEMFRNAVICGRGFTETRIDFDEEAMGKIVVDCLDPLEVGVDPASRKPCFSDSRYFWRYRDVPADEAKAMFPGVDVSALHASWAMQITPQDGGQGNKVDYPEEQRSGFAPALPPKIVRMVQIQWWERESRYLVAGEDDTEPQDIPAGEWESKPQEERDAFSATKVERRRYYQAILGRLAILDQTEKSCFTIRACTGRWDRNKAYHYGVVRPCRDPQMLANKTLSQVLHIINTNAKGGIMYEAGAFANPRDAEKDWSNPAKSIKLAQGGIDKVKPREAPQINPALATLQEFSISSIRDVTGVSVEMLGLADRDQPASLEYQRRQSAMTILANLFNALRHYRKMQGRTLIEQLKLLPPGVLIRVLIDPKQAMAAFSQAMMQWQRVAMQAKAQGQPVPPPPQPPTADFMKQTKQGEVFDPAAFGLGPDSEFDVIVDEMPSSPNQKEATWAAIQPFIAEMPLPLLPAVLKYSPLPESAVEDLKDAIDQMGGTQGIDPKAMANLQQQLTQLNQENQSLKLKNQQLGDRSQLDQAKAAAMITDSETNRLKAISDHSLGVGDQHLQQMQQRLDLLTEAVGHIVSLHQQQTQIGADQDAAEVAAENQQRTGTNG